MKFRKQIPKLLSKSYNLKPKEGVINHNKYLGGKRNPSKIYEGTPSKFIIFPFNMTFDEIDRLMLVDFEGDELYYSIELQIFQINQVEYPLIILYRKDNLIDLYFTEPKILKNREGIVKSLLDNISLNKSDYINAKFKVDEFGLDCSANLTDKFDRSIQFNIREHYTNRKFTSMLTPIGAKSKKPQYLPIIYLNQFGMVIKQETSISIRINEEEKVPIQIPIKIDGYYNYLARFSLNPIICNWNKSYQGDITPLLAKNSSRSLFHNNLIFTLFDNNEFLEIEKIEGKDRKDNKVWFDFSPPIPNLLALRNNKHVKGKFSCCINKIKGIFAGEYYIDKIDNHVNIEILPTKGWQPSSGKLWLKTYKCISEITIQDNKQINVNSFWRRI